MIAATLKPIGVVETKAKGTPVIAATPNPSTLGFLLH
jgi:hypothetical protein